MGNSTPAIVVTHLGGDKLRIQARDHVLFADQPLQDGGGDAAPTPTEIFLAGLTACVAFYAERFLRRNQLPTAGLIVTCDYVWAEHPHRVGAIEMKVDAPGLSAPKRSAFQRVIEHCTVHNTLEHAPLVLIRISSPQTTAAVIHEGNPAVPIDA